MSDTVAGWLRNQEVSSGGIYCLFCVPSSEHSTFSLMSFHSHFQHLSMLWSGSVLSSFLWLQNVYSMDVHIHSSAVWWACGSCAVSRAVGASLPACAFVSSSRSFRVGLQAVNPVLPHLSMTRALLRIKMLFPWRQFSRADSSLLFNAWEVQHHFLWEASCHCLGRGHFSCCIQHSRPGFGYAIILCSVRLSGSLSSAWSGSHSVSVSQLFAAFLVFLLDYSDVNIDSPVPFMF